MKRLKCWALVFIICYGLDSAEATVKREYAFEPQNKGTVFVFVHGIFGDAYQTWTAHNGVRYFDLLKADDLFKDADIYVYGFPSEKFGASFTIDQAATDLHAHLQSAGVLEHDHIVFICHSMGGLVAERFLLRNKDISRKFPLIFLYSTPQEGSAIARVGQYLSSNRALETLIPGDKDQYLMNLDGDWKDAKSKNEILTSIRCAFESKETSLSIFKWRLPAWMFGTTVVDYFSGTRFCEGKSASIDADHGDIVKPESTSDASYAAFKTAYQTVVIGMPTKGPGEYLDEAASNRQIELSSVKRKSLIDRALAAESSIIGTRVLWVDDNPGNNDAERNALSEIGIHVDIAISTSDALNRIENIHWHNQRYDLVISDMNRGLFEPRAGLNLLGQMRERKENTNVIFYTSGRGEDVDISDAFGITTRPDVLFNLVIDALERKNERAPASHN